MKDPLTIRQSINDLKIKDVGFQRFGAERHRYELNPPISESELATFESSCGIRLPDEFRWFVREVGNGGAGPCYGVLPVERGDFKGVLPRLSKPFPHISAWNLEYDLFLTYSDHDDEYFLEKYIHGALPICHYGCGMNALLVVTGAERGNLWMDGRSGDTGIYPLTAPNSDERLTFLSWYEAWLTESTSLEELVE